MYLGICLDGKMILYLGNLCSTEKYLIFHPKPRVAPKRLVFEKKRVTNYDNTISFILLIFEVILQNQQQKFAKITDYKFN